MNLFASIGTICDAYSNGKVLNFNLAVKQEKPCTVPCVLFNPDDEDIKHLENLQTDKKLVCLEGRIATYEFENRGRKRKKVYIATHIKRIKTI